MKRTVQLLLLVLVLVPLILLTRWGSDARAPWSDGADGLRARLRCDRFLWSHGRQVPIELQISNDNDMPVTPPPLALVMHVRREGVSLSSRALTMENVSLLPLSPGQDTRVHVAMLDTSATGPGLYEISGTGAGISLNKLKLRVVPRG